MYGRIEMTDCKHRPFNWDLVYQCKGCGGIVPSDMAEELDTTILNNVAQLEAENEKMNDYIEQFCDEDFVMWCREQDALTGGDDETE
jgi:hypothetical protein